MQVSANEKLKRELKNLKEEIQEIHTKEKLIRERLSNETTQLGQKGNLVGGFSKSLIIFV